jgi:hypothetical protein
MLADHGIEVERGPLQRPPIDSFLLKSKWLDRLTDNLVALDICTI